MKPFDTIVKNGRLVIPFVGEREADIGIRDGVIAAISDDLPAAGGDEVIDAKGWHVFPGVVDPHTHMGTTLPYMEDFETESVSAAFGGVTTYFTTLKLDAFSDEVAPDAAVFHDIIGQIQGRASVDYCMTLFVSYDEQIDRMAYYHQECGVQSFKFSMTYKDRKISPGLDEGRMYRLMRSVGQMEAQPMPMVHCEVDEIIRVLIPEVQADGKEGLSAWNEARPNFTEEMAILKIAYLARLTGAPIYIVHVSSPEGVTLISDFQRQGVKITGETCLHYLALTTETPGVLAKINPPVRTAADRDALWEGLRSGVLTCVGTDHGAKRLEHKGDSIWSATPGFPGMEVFFPVFLTQALDRGFTPTRVAEIVAAQNARAFEIYPRKGTLAVGSDADLLVTDLRRKRVIHQSDLHTAGDFCVYEDFEVFGKPEITMLRGRKIVEDGRLIQSALGEHVPRFPGRLGG